MSPSFTRALLSLALLVLAPCGRGASSSAGNAGFSSPGSDTTIDRVYLPAVPSLAFIRDAFTKARRGDPRPQLHQVAGDAPTPPRVDCFNLDFRNGVVQWHCVATGIVFRHVQVRCEGYSYDQDEWVLKDSCWLSFEAWLDTDPEVQGDEQLDDESLPASFNPVLLTIGSLVGLAAVAVFVFMKRPRPLGVTDHRTPLLADN